MIAFWLGGFVATAILLATEMHATGEPFEVSHLLVIVFWPISLAWFAYDIAKGWRS